MVSLSGPIESLPPPVPTIAGLHFDAGAALLSRQFDRDRDRVLERARSEGSLEGLALWFSDVEKQQSLLDICKQNTGYCYAFVGVHPDNVQNTKKASYPYALTYTLSINIFPLTQPNTHNSYLHRRLLIGCSKLKNLRIVQNVLPSCRVSIFRKN